MLQYQQPPVVMGNCQVCVSIEFSIVSSSLDPKSQRLVPREKIQAEGNTWWLEKYFLSFLFGGLYRRGEWKKRDTKAKRVVSRFGPVFEDARGVPLHKKYRKQTILSSCLCTSVQMRHHRTKSLVKSK